MDLHRRALPIGQRRFQNKSGGWGFSWFGSQPTEDSDSQLFDAYGPAETDPETPYFVGAERKTSATAELPAVAELLSLAVG